MFCDENARFRDPALYTSERICYNGFSKAFRKRVALGRKMAFANLGLMGGSKNTKDCFETSQSRKFSV